MKLNSLVIRQKPLFLFFLVMIITLSQAFSQVTAPASTGTPSSTTGAPSSSGTNAPSQGTGNTNTPANNTTQTANTPKGDAVLSSQEAKSTTEDAERAEGIAEQEGKQKALTAAEQAKAQLRQRIFGYSIFANKGFSPIPQESIATPLDYTIGPGDKLTLYIYGYAQLPEQDLVVNRDGFVSLPRVGNVNLSGKSIQEAQKILLDRYSKFVPSLLGSGGQAAPTKLTLTLSEIRTVNVFVTGEVISPGSYSMNSLSSAFNALYQSGGPNEIGSFREVRVIRNNKVVSTFDIYDYLINGTLVGNIRVQDNDNINVGFYKKRVEVTGNIKRPGIFEVKEGEKLSDILSYAGGFTDNAFRERVKVERITLRERKILDVPMSQFATFELVSGDEINVQPVLDRFENIVSIEGAVMRPGDYSIDSNPSLKVLLESAQGVREDAFMGRIYVTRTRADLTAENITLNLSDIMNNSAPDLLLTRLDVVTIPSKFEMAESATIHIQGEVNNPQMGDNGGNFPYMANMTLEDLILKAGGFKESAKASKVEVVRRVRDSNALAADAEISKIYHFDINRDLSLDGNDSGFPLMPFDEVIVRRSPNYQEQKFIAIEGEVLDPGQYGIKSKDEKITDIIVRAGGLTDLAYLKGATLIRTTFITDAESQQTSMALGQISNDIKKGNFQIGVGPGFRQEFIGIQLDKIMKNPGSNDNLIIQEGDIIRIPKRLETVQVKGELLYPTTVKYNEGMNFLDYVSQSGGFTRASLRRSAYVKYPNGSVDRTRKFLLFNVYPKVEPGSEIYVPVKAGNELTAQQVLQQGVAVTSTLMTLILSILAFRSIR